MRDLEFNKGKDEEKAAERYAKGFLKKVGKTKRAKRS